MSDSYWAGREVRRVLKDILEAEEYEKCKPKIIRARLEYLIKILDILIEEKEK